MKKFLISVLMLLVIAVTLWQSRLNLLLFTAPTLKALTGNIEANKPVVWPQGPESAETTLAKRPPNIILILTDDMGFNDISLYNGGAADGSLQTPNIDHIAEQGIHFNNGYAANAVCTSSRASLLTGRYSTRFGVEYTPIYKTGVRIFNWMEELNPSTPPVLIDMDLAASLPPIDALGMPAAEITIGEVLQQQGYYTAHIGKWHLGRANGMVPNDQGFDDSLLMASGLYLDEDDANVVNAKLDFDPIDKFLWAGLNYAASFNSGDQDRFKPGGYLTDYWTDESIKVIEANKNRPFFLYLAHWGVHTPLQATREDYEAVGDIKPHRLRVYAAMIRALDRSVGRILDSLEEQGLAENTIIAFTSDNGGPGYLGLEDINSPYRGWKITMFEGGIRVPLFVRWPAKIAPGTTVDTPVAHIDMMPTLAAAAGVSPSIEVEIDGLDLLPLTTEQGAANWQRETLFWQSGHYQVVRHGDWKLQVNQRPTDGRQQWLYNLESDPTEQTNLVASHPQIVDQLMALLAAHQQNSVGPLYAPTTNMPVMIDKTLAEKFIPGDEYIYTPN